MLKKEAEITQMMDIKFQAQAIAEMLFDLSIRHPEERELLLAIQEKIGVINARVNDILESEGKDKIPCPLGVAIGKMRAELNMSLQTFAESYPVTGKPSRRLAVALNRYENGAMQKIPSAVHEWVKQYIGSLEILEETDVDSIKDILLKALQKNSADSEKE